MRLNERHCRPRHAFAPACLFLLLAPFAFAQTAAPNPDQAQPTVPSNAPLPSTANEEVVALSPFVVQATNRGYYASSALSGTRLNSNIADLAASVSIVTKRQMEDFALLNTNDIFLYEVGTEGTGTYTALSFDRNGAPTDSSQLDPNNANRIRGIGPANQYFGSFATSGRIPLDPIIIDGVEINRGSNSNIFGIGSASGTVNQEPASANLQRNHAQVTTRVDSYGGDRETLDVNGVIMPGMLAVRGSAVFERDNYSRKPSGTYTTRYNGMIKYQPFKYTTLTANLYYYHMQGNRPNNTMPRDAITGWLQAGSPSWNPVTGMVTVNGASSGPYTASNLPSSLQLESAYNVYNALSTVFVNGNGSIDYWCPSVTTSTANPNSADQNVFLADTVPQNIQAGQPLFSSQPSVSGKSLYDWSRINLAAVNYLRQEAKTYYVDLQQILLDTPMNQLVLDAGFFREDSRSYARNLVGVPASSGNSFTLYIDPNQRLPDGSLNPHFLQPYVGTDEPYSTDTPLNNSTYRLQLAYKLDLRKETNALRWLGMHQFLAYAEYHNFITRTMAYRDVILDNHAWLPAGTPRANQGSNGGLPSAPDVSRQYFRYYVGDDMGENVDSAPHDFAPGQYTYTWGNGVTGQFTREPAVIGQGIAGDSLYSGEAPNTRNILKTEGVVLQSHFLQDRVVTTLGWRLDSTFDAYGAPFVYLPDHLNIDMKTFNAWGDWTKHEGHTTTAGVVVKPLPWLSFHVNRADSFQPSPATLDLYDNPAPEPTGKSNDYGFTLNLLRDKLFIRFNQYETKQINSLASNSNLIAARVRVIDFITPYGLTFPLYNMATKWVTDAAAANHQTLSSDQILSQVAGIMKLSPDFITKGNQLNDFGFSDSGDVVAKGDEIEIDYNPSDFWTVKLNVARDKTIDASVAKTLMQWINQRLPVWKSIIDPETGQPWWTSNYGNWSPIPANFYAGSVEAPFDVAIANLGKSRPEVREYHVNLLTSASLAAISQNRYLRNLIVGGALRWESKGAIGYYGLQQPPATVLALDPSRPVYDGSHLYADAFVAYRTHLFSNKIEATLRLNVRNLQESGRLQPIQAYPDGTPEAYRIIDPREFILTATFDF